MFFNIQMPCSIKLHHTVTYLASIRIVLIEYIAHSNSVNHIPIIEKTREKAHIPN